jgi:hypothetical protein
MANYKWYAIEDFPNYEINSNKEVRNKKTGKKMSVDDRGRVQLTNGDGRSTLFLSNIVRGSIFKGNIFNIEDYPNYGVNEQGGIVNMNRQDVELKKIDNTNMVRISHDGERPTISSSWALAKFKYNQDHKGMPILEKFVNGFDNLYSDTKEYSQAKISKRQLQIVNFDSERFIAVHLLHFYVGFSICYDGCEYFVIDNITGQEVSTRVISGKRHFRLATPKFLGKRNDGSFIVHGTVELALTISDLKVDPIILQSKNFNLW